MPFSRGIKLNRLSGAIDIVKKSVDSLVNAAVGNQLTNKYVKKSFIFFSYLSFVVNEASCCHCIS